MDKKKARFVIEPQKGEEPDTDSRLSELEKRMAYMEKEIQDIKKSKAKT